MSTQSVPNLNTPEGRRVYGQYWHDLVVVQRNMVLPSLVRLWQSAVSSTSINIATTGANTEIVHPLGLRSGTRLFMEEIVVRHYFNNIQALVYLGAVLLLISLGLRFAGLLSERIALIGIGIEVLMLLLLFVVLFYTPEEHDEIDQESGLGADSVADDAATSTIREVLDELEEIGGHYAALGMRIEKLANTQTEQVAGLTEHVQKIRGLEELHEHSRVLTSTNELLRDLSVSIERMNQKIDLISGAEIEHHVRKEIARRFGEDLSGSLNQTESS